jgi:HlyD family secretion protein
MKIKPLLRLRVVVPTAAVIALGVVALRPVPVTVETGLVARRPLTVTIDGDAVTRVRDRYLITAPLAGRVGRIELEPGDEVGAGATVARVRPEQPALLDRRARADAEAAIAVARASLDRARADEQRSAAALVKARRDLARARELAAGSVIAPSELDAAESSLRIADETHRAAEYAVQVAAAELERAKFRLDPPADRLARGDVRVLAPVGGVVLKRLRESEAVVPAGEPLLEIGDPARLEIVCDLLSTDGVRVRPGARALIEGWGGDCPLEARLRRVEPGGFTKVSALGVEEQRVNVILDPVGDPALWRSLGDGYRVEVRIVTWESGDVLLMPTAALFRSGDQWAVYVAERGRARLVPVVVGHQTPESTELLDGVVAGATVVLHPPDTLRPAMRIRVGAPQP